MNSLNVGQFRHQIQEMCGNRAGLVENARFHSKPTREDKHLREELLAAVAMIKYWSLDDATVMEIGGEGADFDVRLRDRTLEIVQAVPYEHLIPLPTDFTRTEIRGHRQIRKVDEKLHYVSGEHHFRHSLPYGASPFQYFLHAQDHLDFPQVIIDAIQNKQRKCYADTRTLCVVFDGDYCLENDEVIRDWIIAVQKAIDNFAPFQAVYLIDRARCKAMPVKEDFDDRAATSTFG
jgi:hypothetical protein